MDRHPSRARSTSATLEPRVSAIVVAHKVRANSSGRAPLDLCLRSALAEDWIDELIVVDHDNPENISSTLRAFEADRRDVRVVRADPSLSLAAAGNVGAAEARGRWLLFLNADVVLQRGAVARLAAAGGGAQQPWIVGGRLLDLEGRERQAARTGALNTFSAIAVAVEWPARPLRKGDDAAKVGAVSGALMLIPRGDFNELNGFDEQFDTDYADLDLCRRAALAGGSVLFQPDASGVQFEYAQARKSRKVQGLTRFAVKSAETPIEKAFARVAGPALATLLALKDLIAGRPPARR
ncbi:glycosyltransferase [Candidatus Viadribacter manganicus]|uniref:glycosyltransferase n=1 Tax=Candidatus Viadribacter manganicus TaxID=1759059 RepID=UPI001D177E91|nr:glycosyltransferase [Candidatus Viadribacter manganicus]